MAPKPVLSTLLLLTPVLGASTILAPGAAYARGGGGVHGFGGGGHFGGGHFGSGGGGGFFFFGGGGGGSGGNGSGLLILLVLIVAYVAIRAWSQRRRRVRSSTTTSDRAAHRTDRDARVRAATIEAQVSLLSDTDPTFDVDALKDRAVDLYVTAQRAWPAGDEATLRDILAPVLYGKWVEELREYRARGEVNVVDIVEAPLVEMVDVANRAGEARDTVTFRITATLEDRVVRGGRATATRTDHSTRPVEYWTLRKDDLGRWIVASIEQAEDGAHHLTDAIETDGWNQQAVAREATLEAALGSVPGPGPSSGSESSQPEHRGQAGHAPDVLSLTGISWATEAGKAAADLSVVDPRFDTSVLEVAVADFLEEWRLNDGSLDFTALRTPHRTVLRTATINGVEVRALVSREPIAFQVAVATEGIYYEVSRATEEVLAGDAHRRRFVTFLFTLRLNDSGARGWTVTGAEAAG